MAGLFDGAFGDGGSGILPDWMFDPRMFRDPSQVPSAPGAGGIFGGMGFLPQGWSSGAYDPQNRQEAYSAGLSQLKGAMAPPDALMARAEAPLPPPISLASPMGSPPSMGAPPAAPASPPIPPGAAGPGFGDRLMAGLQGFAHGGAIIPAIGNLIGGLATGQRQDPGGMMAEMQGRAQTAFAKALMEKGVSPNEAVAAALNPELGKMLIARKYPELKFEKIGEQFFGSFNPSTGKFEMQGTVPKFEKLGSGDTLHQVVPSGPGGAPSAVQVATGGPEKAPEGYEWVDKANPSKGLKPIGGGPATKLPANEAGYLAMMQASKQGVEAARKYFLDPNFKSGAVDAAGKAIGQATNSFDIGRHQRSLTMAIEAALRIATGAAAPESEVKRYANLYMPSVYDSEATRKQKLDSLQKFMSYAEKNIGSGRMPEPESFMNTKSDPLGLR